MDEFIGPDFLLTNEPARTLYHQHAQKMPILDFHSHLDATQIADNHQFETITQAWLGGDHYKWRAMRWNGVREEYITGQGSDYEKFYHWAQTIPYTMRNPLYHWTHLELVRHFGIHTILKPETAAQIYAQCNAQLSQPEFRAQSLLRRSGVEVVCTTDDPIDSLEAHARIAAQPFGVRVLPTWRPDRALAVGDPLLYNAYINQLEKAANLSINTYEELLEALRLRHDYFALHGCRLSDQALDTFPVAEHTEADLLQHFAKVRSGKHLTASESNQLRSGLLFDLALMNHEKEWTQQFHLGALRNNNSRQFTSLGADTGFDAMNDLPCAQAGHRFLDRLDRQECLAQTILYNLNPKDTLPLAVMAGTFAQGPTPGKVQLGAAWWFLDQEKGMIDQLNALSAVGLLSRFVGMLTDSRSLLSYPRHEYFRRILCNLLGQDISLGKLPQSEMPFIGKLVEGISYHNAKQYFAF